jgi:hypothetical protein
MCEVDAWQMMADVGGNNMAINANDEIVVVAAKACC